MYMSRPNYVFSWSLLLLKYYYGCLLFICTALGVCSNVKMNFINVFYYYYYYYIGCKAKSFKNKIALK